MRKTYVVLIAVLTMSLTLCSLNQAFNVCYALSDTKVYLDSSNNTFYSNQTGVGHLFNVTVKVENAVNVSAAQIYMEFNDSAINATRWFEPKNDPEYIFKGKATSALPSPPYDLAYRHFANDRAYILVTVTLFPPPPDQLPFTGNGSICIFEFNMTTGPPPVGSVLSLHNSTMLTYYTYLLRDPPGDEVPNLLLEDGSYTYLVPEFPLTFALCLLMASVVAVAALRKRIVQKLSCVW